MSDEDEVEIMSVNVGQALERAIFPTGLACSPKVNIITHVTQIQEPDLRILRGLIRPSGNSSMT